MKKRQMLYVVFGICFLFSCIIFAISQKDSFSGVGVGMQFLFSPLQKITLRTTQSLYLKPTADDLKKENTSLKTQITKLQLAAQDNIALRDQFQTAHPAPKTLLPATVIGMPSFFPGVSAPEAIILDKGEKDGVRKGSVVVYKDTLVGVVSKSNAHFSFVTAVGNKATSFTAKTAKTNALGVVRGEGNGQMIFDNVVLSDTLQQSDTIVTGGNSSLDGIGYPAGLIVGQITSVEKNPSALFQRADIESLIDVTRVSTVFVIINK